MQRGEARCNPRGERIDATFEGIGALPDAEPIESVESHFGGKDAFQFMTQFRNFFSLGLSYKLVMMPQPRKMDFFIKAGSFGEIYFTLSIFSSVSGSLFLTSCAKIIVNN